MSIYHQSKEEILQELEVIKKAQVNPERFGPLYDKYYKAIFVYIYKRTDNEELCADLCSQVFLKALSNIHKYEYKGVPFSAWLYRIASNEINQYFRKSKGQRTISIEDAGIERMRAEMDESYEDIEELENVIIKYLNLLSPEEVQLIELRFFEDHSFKEVAYILNITENNAKVKTYRILDKVRKLIKESEQS